MSADPSNNRLDTLELKFMDLENTVQELHEVILKQYQDIDRLETLLKSVTSRLDNSSPGNRVPTAVEELPPHY